MQASNRLSLMLSLLLTMLGASFVNLYLASISWAQAAPPTEASAPSVAPAPQTLPVSIEAGGDRPGASAVPSTVLPTSMPAEVVDASLPPTEDVSGSWSTAAEDLRANPPEQPAEPIAQEGDRL